MEEKVTKKATKKPEYIYGTLKGKINFRKKPSYKAEILGVYPRDTKIKIDLVTSTDEFYCTIIDGIRGYFGKPYVDVPAKVEDTNAESNSNSSNK